MKELEIYNKLYNARTLHANTLTTIITEHVDALSSLVIEAATHHLVYVDSSMLLDLNSTLLKKLAGEKRRFENEMRTVLGIVKEESNDSTN